MKRTRHIALGGLSAALSLIFLGIACVAPTGRLGISAVAGLFPAFAVIAGGLSYGFACWGTAGLLGLLLLPDKLVAILYLSALGFYPVLKSVIERLHRLAPEWLLKLLFFNGMFTVLGMLFQDAFFQFLPDVLNRGYILYAAGNTVFVAYDLALSRLLTAVAVRLKKGLRKP